MEEFGALVGKVTNEEIDRARRAELAEQEAADKAEDQRVTDAARVAADRDEDRRIEEAAQLEIDKAYYAEAEAKEIHQMKRAILAAGRHLDGYFLSASTVKPKRTRWFWDLRIPRHEVSILAGVQGRGKSMVTVAIVAGATRGKFGYAPCDVLMLSAEEDPATTIVPRLMAAGADLDRVHIHKIEKRLELPKDIAVIEAALDMWPVGLVVIDPFLSFLNEDTDSYSGQQVRNAMRLLNVVKQRATILCVIHFRKESSQEVIHQITSSSAFTEIPRSVLGLGQEPDTSDDDGRLALGHLKCNVGKRQPVRLVHIEPVEIPDPDGGHPIATARAVFDDECGLSIEDIFRPSKGGRPPAAHNDATVFLAGEAAAGGGKVCVKDARVKYVDGGMGSYDTLKRAATGLGLMPELTNGEWWWIPPTS